MSRENINAPMGSADLLLTIEVLKEQLIEERKRREAMGVDMDHYKLEYKNYLLSWTMEKAEVERLRGELNEQGKAMGKKVQEEREKRLALEKRLEVEREMRMAAEKLSEKHRIEYKNYLLSWTMEKAEAEHLRGEVKRLLEEKEKEECKFEKTGNIDEEKGQGDVVSSKETEKKVETEDSSTQTVSVQTEPCVECSTRDLLCPKSSEASDILSNFIIPRPPTSLPSTHVHHITSQNSSLHVPSSPVQARRPFTYRRRIIYPESNKPCSSSVENIKHKERPVVPWR